MKCCFCRKEFNTGHDPYIVVCEDCQKQCAFEEKWSKAVLSAYSQPNKGENHELS